MKNYWTNEREKPKFLVGNLFRTADKKNVLFLKLLQQIGLTISTELQKLSVTRYHLIINNHLRESFIEALLKK